MAIALSEIISRFSKLVQRLGFGHIPSVRELLAADADGASEEVGRDATQNAFAVDGAAENCCQFGSTTALFGVQLPHSR